jgi:hypothetical protein
VVAGEAGVVRAGSHREAHLGGDQPIVPSSLDGLTDDLLGTAAEVDVGGVDEVDAVVAAQVQLSLGRGPVDASRRLLGAPPSSRARRVARWAAARNPWRRQYTCLRV